MVESIVLRKVKTSEELPLDSVSTPDFVLKSVDWGTVKGTHHSYKYVNQTGVSITNTSIGTRDIVIEGWIVAQSETQMTNLKGILNAFINPQEEFELLYDKYMIKFKPNESVRYSATLAENNDAFCKFMITGMAPNPMFTENVENKSVFASTIASFHFPITFTPDLPEKGIVFGKRTASLIANANNGGTVAVGVKIVFKANGSITNPKLININTLEEFKINKTIVSGEEVIINTNVGKKSVIGRIGNGAYENYYMYKDIDSTWLKLEVGDNMFRYDADSGADNLDVFVYYNNEFMEVEECK